MFGQCLSSNVGGRALTPPTRHSLGELLPHQLADRTQASPKAINLYSVEHIAYYPGFLQIIRDFGVNSYVIRTRLPCLCLTSFTTGEFIKIKFKVYKVLLTLKTF